VQIYVRAALWSGVLGAVVSLWATAAEAQTLTANATLAPAGSNAYSITLNNTSATATIGTFWYAWIPGQDYMSVLPTNIASPPGWTDLVTGSGGASDGYAIQWKATSSADYLAAGSSLSGFSFDSTLSSAQLTTGSSPYFSHPATETSFVYNQAPFSAQSYQFVVDPVPDLHLCLGGCWCWRLAGRARLASAFER